MEKSKESEILAKWDAERSMYDAWGKIVATMLKEAIQEKITPTSIDLFLKIPITSRVKSSDSLITKALFRKKSYADPYNDIEDKVGVRIIVLRSKEIELICNALEASEMWQAHKARDFDTERMRSPFVFDYQSVHYVVRSKTQISHEGLVIQSDTPCEVQIRTLLQHAHSELTHDTIYKPNVAASQEVKRAAAKSMALIEATDDYFNTVHDSINFALKKNDEISKTTAEIYEEVIKLRSAPTPLNEMIIDHYKQWAPDDSETVLRNYMKNEKRFLVNDVHNNYDSSILYKQPSILLVYWAITNAPEASYSNSPLSNNELSPIYAILGEPLPKSY